MNLGVEVEECFVQRINDLINNDPENLMKNFGGCCTYVTGEMRFCSIVGLFLQHKEMPKP